MQSEFPCPSAWGGFSAAVISGTVIRSSVTFHSIATWDISSNTQGAKGLLLRLNLWDISSNTQGAEGLLLRLNLSMEDLECYLLFDTVSTTL